MVLLAAQLPLLGFTLSFVLYLILIGLLLSHFNKIIVHKVKNYSSYTLCSYGLNFIICLATYIPLATYSWWCTERQARNAVDTALAGVGMAMQLLLSFIFFIIAVITTLIITAIIIRKKPKQ